MGESPSESSKHSHEIRPISPRITFPYPPYPQQQQLMECMLQCINKSSIGLLESPTGTGKSLSIICSTIAWLLSEEERLISELKSSSSELGSSKQDWLADFLSSSDSPQKKAVNTNNLDAYSRIIEKIKSQSKSLPISGNFISGKREVETNGEEFLLRDSESDEENDREFSDGSWDSIGLPQIIYCSRTHSQLTQFVSEVKKAGFGNIRLVVLGSRKSLCVNESVSSSVNEWQTNEKCVELISKGLRKSHLSATESAKKRQKTGELGCLYHKSTGETYLANQILSSVQNIEEVVNLGASQQSCPFFSVRKAVPYAQIICLTYNSLFDQDIRKANHIRLHSNQVIIVDEAHNLVDAINQIHSAECDGNDILLSILSLQAYLKRFQTVLSHRNLYYINILKSILQKLKVHTEADLNSFRNKSQVLEKENGFNSIQIMGESANEQNSYEIISSLNNFLFSALLDNINFFKLKKYLEMTNLAAKIGGYMDHAIKCDTDGSYEDIHRIMASSPTSSLSSLRRAVDFISSFTLSEKEGRIWRKTIYSRKGDICWKDSKLKFFLLDPHSVVQSIVESVKSFVLLGGTMKPFSYMVNNLFPFQQTKPVVTFSCSHIISPDNVKALVITSAENVKFEFTHSRKFSLLTTDALFSVLVQVASTVPKGIVVFFTSYNYLELVCSRWKICGKLQELSLKKKLFLESKHSDLNLWLRYCEEVSKPSSTGAMLLTVVNGRLSEGINFCDDLARGVVVIGMPYPDGRDIVFQEKVKYYQQRSMANAIDVSEGKIKDPPISYLANPSLQDIICMRAVNQAIGRSIRHVNDFSCIFLVDSRYANLHIQNQLPDWIRQAVTVIDSTNALDKNVIQFFSNRSKVN